MLSFVWNKGWGWMASRALRALASVCSVAECPYRCSLGARGTVLGTRDTASKQGREDLALLGLTAWYPPLQLLMKAVLPVAAPGADHWTPAAAETGVLLSIVLRSALSRSRCQGQMVSPGHTVRAAAGWPLQPRVHGECFWALQPGGRPCPSTLLWGHRSQPSLLD